MDVYGGISVDDLLDLPNDDFFPSSSSSSSAATATGVSNFLHHHHHPAIATTYFDQPGYSTDFNDILSVPNEDAAELEWLSTYMDDSFTDFPTTNLTTANTHHRNNNNASASFHGRARSKRSRPSSEQTHHPHIKKEDVYYANNNDNGTEVGRRCTHCASEKTPQWRTGPMGPKTLCNACGVRYKSGRLVPEYRPAASPTFVLTQHSNSHRKVMELRRQKEVVWRGHQQGQGEQDQDACGRHFRVC